MPRPDSVERVSPWPNPSVPWSTRLPSERTTRPQETTATIARGRWRTKPATRDQRADLPPEISPRPGQKARLPSSARIAGSRVRAAASITAIPIASTGPSQRVDSSSASSRTNIAATTVPAEAAIARTLSASDLGSATAGSRPRASSSR